MTHHRRIGRFTITDDCVYYDPKFVRAILKDCLVMRAEHLMAQRKIEYVAVHPDFVMCELGDTAPDYHYRFEKDEDRYIRKWCLEPPSEQPDLIVMDRFEFEDVSHRIGTFTAHMVDYEERLVKLLMDDCIIIRATDASYRGTILYTAMHHEFDMLTSTPDVIPSYMALFTRHDDGTITKQWVKDRLNLSG
jgi:hypothetical protein